jgi:hypothetical protein
MTFVAYIAFRLYVEVFITDVAEEKIQKCNKKEEKILVNVTTRLQGVGPQITPWR